MDVDRRPQQGYFSSETGLISGLTPKENKFLKERSQSKCSCRKYRKNRSLARRPSSPSRLLGGTAQSGAFEVRKNFLPQNRRIHRRINWANRANAKQKSLGKSDGLEREREKKNAMASWREIVVDRRPGKVTSRRRSDSFQASRLKKTNFLNQK
jgi:hypothetical protein